MSIQKILIVGTGFSGSTIARLLAESGHKVDIIDKRAHIAGNAYDYDNELGIRVHKYGPHIFHTNNKTVVDFLSQFTDWVKYYHKVRAMLHDGSEVVLPPNKETQDILGLDNIIKVLFEPYTLKMWGISIDKINPDIINRVKIRNDYNENYFPDDKFQYMPKNGYTKLIEKMLNHKNIHLETSKKFTKDIEDNYSHIFNSMPIDEYFDFKFGYLPYRSIKFHNYNIPHVSINSVPTINFTHDEKYTRVTEWKKFPNHGENKSWTTLTFEEPCDYTANNFERYYPVKDIDGKNRNKYSKYLSLTPKNVTFIGRCGLYAYLDMHQAVSSAMAIARNFLDEQNK